MLIDLNTPIAGTWLLQFKPADQSSALELLESVDFVTANQFQQGLTQLLLEVAEEDSLPVALFTEREMPRQQDGAPVPLYEHKQGSVRRAVGAGPKPVVYDNPDSHETGSEGLIANIITGIRKHCERGKILDHPSPDEVRKRRPRRFVIVTDIIGSGNRVREYLEAAWRTPSIVSWASYRLVRFEVVAYSGTEPGIEHVKNHSSHPAVHIVKGCPTISLLPSLNRGRLIKLCEDYCPREPRKEMTALGYKDTGALLVFAHGAPNNTPLLLHAASKRWHPLFRARSTINVYTGEPEQPEDWTDRTLLYLGETQLSKAGTLQHVDPPTQETILVLAALKRRPRNMRVASARTGLSLKVVYAAISRAMSAGFLTDDLRLTDAAYRELSYLRKSNKTMQEIDEGNNSYYYPSMLRPPIEAFR